MIFHFYIETSPSAFSMQASEISEKIKNPEEHVFILRQGLDYKDEFKEKSNVTIINISYDNISDIMFDILKSILRTMQPSIYLHFGAGHGQDICTLLTKAKYPCDKVYLRIYEDDPLSIITRETLLALEADRRENALSAYAQSIYDKIYTLNTNLISTNGWNSVATYSYSYLFDTIYYSIDGTAFSEKRLNISPLPETPIPQSLLFTFSEIELAREFVDHSTLLVIFRNDYSTHDYQANIENIINELKANSIYQHIEKLIIWGGRKTVSSYKGFQILNLPNSIPLYFLKRANVLPRYIAGEMCTEIFLMAGHEVIITLLPINTTPQEQLTGKFAAFANNKNITLVDNDALSSPNNVRIFRCAASMGDVVFALGALTALKKQRPASEKFILIANQLFEDLIDACPAVDCYWPLNFVSETKSKLIEAVGKLNKIHVFDRWEQIIAPKHMSLAFLDEFNYDWNHNDLQPQLDLSKLDKTRVDAFIQEHNLAKGKTVLLHAIAGSPNRTWTEEGWNTVADHMVASGWQVVLIGHTKKNTRKRDMITITNPEVISAVNSFSILESVYLMQQCALLVACDSGPVALAGITSISIVSIYSQIAALNRLPFRNGEQGWNALGIDVGCPTYGACGRFVDSSPGAITGSDFDEWCPDGYSYACMKGLSGQTIVQLIDHFLQSDDYIPQAARA